MKLTREKIIEAAKYLFGQKGYHSTSIQEISQKAEISKGLIYHYFSNKSEILFEIHDHILGILIEQAEKIMMRDDLSASDKLREMMIDLIQMIMDSQPNMTVFFQELKYTPEDILTRIKSERDRFEKVFKQALEKGIADGEFRKDTDIEITAKAIFGMCNWTYQWFDPSRELSTREIGMKFYDIVIKGIRLDL